MAGAGPSLETESLLFLSSFLKPMWFQTEGEVTRPCVAKSFFSNKCYKLPYECSKFRRNLPSNTHKENISFSFLWNSLFSGARIFCEFLCNQEWSELSVRHQNPITCYQLWQLWLLQQSQNNPLTIWLMRPSGDNFISLNSKYWLPSNRFLFFFIHVVGKWHFTYFAMDCLNSHILHVTAENFL